MTDYRIVPAVATEAMVYEACRLSCVDCHGDCRYGPYAKQYTAMLAAAPAIDYDALAKELMHKWLTAGSMAQALREVLP